MSGHTPGVWTLLHVRGAEVFDDEGEIIMSMNRPSEEVMANARLISAAPELLSVARSVAAMGFHTMPKGQPECVCSRCELVREARAVIAKATGSAP